MKANGNGTPETCASNLLRIVRGEVPYDRVRGRDGALIDQPNAADEAMADAEWLLGEYEPRVEIADVSTDTGSAAGGDLGLLVNIKRKEQSGTWLNSIL